jgi:hypothetical protein
MVKHGTVNALFFFKAQPDIDFRKHVKNKCTQQVTYWGKAPKQNMQTYFKYDKKEVS